MASKPNGTLYVGVTNNLIRRVWEHRNGISEGFARKYKCVVLVYFEFSATMENAILREKQIKGGSRMSKIKLIERDNKNWVDLYGKLV